MVKSEDKNEKLFPVVYSGGSKGGVGKSLFSTSLIDIFTAMRLPCHLIETDGDNPDVLPIFAAYNTEKKLWVKRNDADDLTFTLVPLTEDEEDFFKLMNDINEHKNRIIVINSKAGNDQPLALHGKWLNKVVDAIKKPLAVFWLVNHDLSGIPSLEAFLQTIKTTQIHVVKNEGENTKPRPFLFDSDAAAKELISNQGGKTFYLPNLPDRIRTPLYGKFMSMADQYAKGDFATQCVISQHRAALSDIIDAIIDITEKGIPND